MRKTNWFILALAAAVLAFAGGCEDPKDAAMKSLERENFKFTPVDFIRAASIGDNAILGQYLVAGMDIDTRGPEGDTALLAAAERGHARTVEYLIGEGAEVNARSKDGWTPLMMAAFNNQTEIVELLLASGGDPEKKDNSGWTALMQAVYKGHTRVVEAILGSSSEGADRALLVASLMGHSDVVRVLLDGGAGINARTEENDTPLMLAAQKGRLETVEVLLGEGADVSLTNNVGDTARGMAEERGHPEIASLIEEAAILQARNREGEAVAEATPRPVARASEATEQDRVADAEGTDSPERGPVDVVDIATRPGEAAESAGETVAVAGEGSGSRLPDDSEPEPEGGVGAVSEADMVLTDGEAVLPAPSEGEWFERYGLDIDDPEMYTSDPDGDGFTNREEFLNDTSPMDPGSHPLHITRAIMVEYASSDLPYVLESVRGDAASVRHTGDNRILTVREGDSLGGLTVERVRHRVISSKESQQADVSDLTLQDPSTGRSTLLVRGMTARVPDSSARIEVPGMGGPVEVREGETFSLPGEEGVSYQVFEVRPTQVIVRRTDGSSTYTVQMAE